MSSLSRVLFKAENVRMMERSPAGVFVQDLQDLLVGPACRGLEERENTASAVQVVFLFGRGERGQRVGGGRGGGGRAAQ